MGKNFKNLKKKMRLVSVLASAAFGIALGALVLSGIIFTLKLQSRQAEAIHYIIGIASAVISSVVFAFVLAPSDKRFAKRLDEEYNLKEKARTMVEFKSSHDPFAVLQREDADEKIGRLEFRHIKKKQLISLLLTVFISGVTLTVAFIVPGKAEYIEPEKPLTEFDKQWILAELSDIIKYVTDSPITSSLKTDALLELNSLSDFVEEHEYLSEMKIEAIKKLVSINGSLVYTNTASSIGERLSECSNQTLKDLGAELVKLNATGAQRKLSQLCDELSAMDETDVTFVADEIIYAISVSGADSELPFTEILSSLASRLVAFANGSISSIDDAFGNVSFDVLNETLVQNVNKMVIQTVISRISKLFGITAEDLENYGAGADIDIAPPADLPPDSDEGTEGEDDDDQQIGSGGIGSGDRVYGSNDVIYNPYTNEYVPYGQVLDEYNSKMLQMLDDERIPPSFEEFMKEYFRSLSDYTEN